ncbi:MAG: hypothetical protein COA50_16570 [Flavobacteriaceae bacterium]|nr:MAG: hypothetical protein COA50_16570 [Flavobacteriaceae bacterium]
MARSPIPDARSTADTLSNERFQIHPSYNTDEDGIVPDNWLLADIVRSILNNKGQPGSKSLETLAVALNRQLRTLRTYMSVLDLLAKGGKSQPVTFYTLMFPGEGKDNTGIKDLNDKVLGYDFNGQFINKRHIHIGNIFHPDFYVVGLDYKTANMISLDRDRKEFDRRLRKLDGALRSTLLNDILPDAEKYWKSQKGGDTKVKNIIKLRRVLMKDPKYKFDIFYGLIKWDGVSREKKLGLRLFPVDVAELVALNFTFKLATESLKAAAMARYVRKGRSLRVRTVRPFGKRLKPDKGFDDRGKQFVEGEFFKVIKTESDIKEFVTQPFTKKSPYNYNTILVDTVWTSAFLIYHKRYVGNPDVIRDVRKGLLKRPTLISGMKFTFRAQKEALELWMVVLNTIDFVKDFLSGEFHKQVKEYHRDAKEMFAAVTKRPQKGNIDWVKLRDVLTKDVRQSSEIAVLGKASEFLFYAEAADYSERIFFSFDVRDLGVELALLYENSVEEIDDKRYDDFDLMIETFRASDPINERMRHTIDKVKETFKVIHSFLSKGVGGMKFPWEKHAIKAFGQRAELSRVPVEFDKAVQIMLGGDEVFVAAHPAFTRFVPEILKTLDREKFKNGPLNMRAVVSFSKADVPNNRRRVQYSHYMAIKAADSGSSILKEFERTESRIERLIELLTQDPKKINKAKSYSQQLRQLGLTKIFVKLAHGKPLVTSINLARDRFGRLEAGRLRTMDGDGLYDLNGKKLDVKKFAEKAKKLETQVRRSIGTRNYNVDPPPVRKTPKILDDYLKGKKFRLKPPKGRREVPPFLPGPSI